MVSSNMGFDEEFSDAQDITDSPIISEASSKQSKRTKARKQKKIIDEEFRLLKEIKKAIEDISPKKNDRKKEKAYANEKERDNTQADILKNLEALVKLAKSGKMGGGGKGFSPDINIGGKDKKHKRKDKLKDLKEEGEDLYSRSLKGSKETTREAKKSLLKRGLKVGGRALPFVGAGIGALALSNSSGSKSVGSILEAALSGGAVGGEFGAFFDGIGAIPGAIAGALLGAGSEFAKEYKDDLTPALNDFTDGVKDVVGGILSTLGNATDFIKKHIPSMGDIKGDIKEGWDKVTTDAGIVASATQHSINRSADSALVSSGRHMAYDPEIESAINSITTGPGAINRELAIAAAQGESGGGVARDSIQNGKNKSTAKGMYQFVDKTAGYLSGKYGIDISNIYDPHTQAALFKANATENNKLFKTAYGRDANNKELYLSSFLGGQGAINMINASKDPNAIAAKVNPSAYASNTSMFQDKQGNKYTAKQLIDHFYDYYDSSLKKGLSLEANARKKFGMKDDGSVTNFKDEVKPVVNDIKDGGKRIANAMDDAAKGIVSEAKADTTGFKSSTNEQIKVTAKRPPKNVKPDWFHRAFPRTSLDVDNIAGVGRSLYSGIIDGKGYIHSDFTVGDRGFVNRDKYKAANQGALNWLRTGSYATPTADSISPSVSRDATLNTKESSNDTDGKGRSPVIKPKPDITNNKDRDKEIRDKPSVSNAKNKTASSMTPTQAIIGLDDIPMFLQDSGIIIINSGRGV